MIYLPDTGHSWTIFIKKSIVIDISRTKKECNEEECNDSQIASGGGSPTIDQANAELIP